jgi:hypothetical protein
MARQSARIGRLIVLSGETVSNALEIHESVAAITLYMGYADADATVELSPGKDGGWFKYIYRGSEVKLSPFTATDVPVPACHSIRVSLPVVADQDVEVTVVELLDL